MLRLKRLKERMDVLELINTDILQKLLEQKKTIEKLEAKLNELEKLNAFLLMEKVAKSLDDAIMNGVQEPEKKPAPKKKAPASTKTKKAVNKNGK